jgi:serine/threonine-protein kinase
MGAQVARSLREAHKLGLVHGDLSPAAIMMLSEGPTGDLVKVLDFGMARRTTGPAYRLGAANRLELTPAGEQLGSFLYMAPERARSELDPRGDLYSLGAVLFMAIAGRTPFLGQRPAEVLAKHLRERPPELRDFVEVPDELNRLVLRCLEKVPEARFASADELLDAIRAAATGSGVASLFADVGPRASPRVPVPPPLPSKRPLRRALSGRLGAWRSAWRGAPGQPRPWWSRLLRRR